MYGLLFTTACLALAAPPGGTMLATPDGTIAGVIASPDGKLVAANVRVDEKAKDGSAAGYHCLVWDAKTGEVKNRFPPVNPNEASVIAVLFSADGKRLIEHLRQVELETKVVAKFPATLPFPSGSVSGRVSQDRSRIASLTTGNDGATIRVWDVDAATMAAKERVSVKLTKGQVADSHPLYAISGDKTTLAYSYRLVETRLPGAIKVVDIETGKERQSIPIPDVNNVDFFVMSPDGNTIYAHQQALNRSDTVLTNVWDVKTGKVKATWTVGRLGRIRITDDGRYIVAATGRKYTDVTVIDVKTGKPYALIPTPYEGIAGLDVAPDGSWVAIAGGKLNDPRQVGVWKVADYKK